MFDVGLHEVSLTRISQAHHRSHPNSGSGGGVERTRRLIGTERDPSDCESPATLLDVLHLLLDTIDRPLDLHDPPRDLDVEALARDRVRFAEHLLGDEVERATDRLDAVRVDELGELREVTLEPRDLLGDVGSFSEDRDLAKQVLLANRRPLPYRESVLKVESSKERF